MFINMPYRYLVIVSVVCYVLHIVLGVKPNSLVDYEWEKPQMVIVKQANRILECFFVIALAWFFKNYYLLSHSLYPLIWVLRVFSGIAIFRQITFLIPFFFSPMNAADKRVVMSIFIAIACYALLFISI